MATAGRPRKERALTNAERQRKHREQTKTKIKEYNRIKEIIEMLEKRNPSPEEDYYAWAINTAKRARARILSEKELDEIAEELEDMAKSERRELKNRLSVLLAHLLKWQCQPDQISRSWQGTITEQRLEIKDLLEENPSLKQEVKNTIEKSYKIGIQKAIQNTKDYAITFPPTLEETGWTIEQVLDIEYFPN